MKTFAIMSAASVLLGVVAFGCGGSDDATSQTAPASAGAGGAGGGSAGSAGQTAAGQGGGGASAVELAFPQFVRGAATVNPEAFETIAVEITATPSVASLTAKLDGTTDVVVTKEGDRFWATVDAKSLSDGPHTLAVTGGSTTKSVTLRASAGSTKITSYQDVGFALCTTLIADPAKDRLLLAYLHKKDADKHAFVAQVDGAGQRVVDADLVLDTPDAPADRLNVAFGGGKLAALTQVKKMIGANPSVGVRARIIDVDTQKELLAPVDLLDTSAGLPGGQSDIAWDGSQFVAVWQELELPDVVKRIKLARIDPSTGKVSAKVTIATGETNANEDGKIDDLQRLAIACNKTVCAVGYSKRKYSSLVQLSSQKTHVAIVDLATMTVGTNAPALSGNWDIQEDTALSVAADGSFVFGFVGTNTELALDNKDAQKVYFAKLGADGAMMGKPAPVMSDEGQRYNSGIGAHPAGAALFWEDQREKDVDLLKGQNRLSLNFVKDGKLERDYFFLPRSRIVVEPFATAVPAGSNYSLAWIDERSGGTVLDPRGEVYFETYWRK